MDKNINGRHKIVIVRTVKENGYGTFKNGELIDYETDEIIDEIDRDDKSIRFL